jgi:predicted RNase H-like nuclease (RuvC/YqgF family)
MNNTITLFPDEEMVEKFEQRREELGMSEEEYFAHLMELSDEYEYAENKDEEPEEEDEEPETLEGIEDVSDKDTVIKELKSQLEAQEEEVKVITEKLNEVTNYPRFNLIFNLVRGHTLRIDKSKYEATIKDKKDLIQLLVKNFHYHLDSEDFGIDSDDFEEMENEALNLNEPEDDDE